MSNSDQAVLKQAWMDDEPQEWWTDERIELFLRRAKTIYRQSWPYVDMASARDLASRIRNDLSARIVALQAEVERLKAGTWQPVEDGPYGDIDVSDGGTVIAVRLYEDDGQSAWQGCHLFDRMRLCRIIPANAPVVALTPARIAAIQFFSADYHNAGTEERSQHEAVLSAMLTDLDTSDAAQST